MGYITHAPQCAKRQGDECDCGATKYATKRRPLLEDDLVIEDHVYTTDYAGLDKDLQLCQFVYEKDGVTCLRTPYEHAHRTSVRDDPVDMVNSPPHYDAMPGIDFECIELTRWMSFNVGNACKYVWRADRKNGKQDLQKSLWYVKDRIEHGGDWGDLSSAEPLLLKIIQCKETPQEKVVFFEAIRCNHMTIARLILDLMILQAS